MVQLPGVLGAAGPVHIAPMAGGPSTPALVTAAARAGSFAQLAAGYRTPESLAAEVASVRASGTTAFGVNLFVPNPVPISDAEYDRYRRLLAHEPGAVPVPKREDDDAWEDKVALLLRDPVPVVSFTFGLPDAATVQAFRRRGTVTVQSVTDPDEARAAEDHGVDALVVQGVAAGGHSAVLDPARVLHDRPLPDLVRAVVAATSLPVVTAGGIGTSGDVTAALAAGASATAVGTFVLRTDEAGTSYTHRNALGDPAFRETALTRAFTGRPARALVNDFVRAHTDAPLGYPALHHLTKPIRGAAADARAPERLHLWAGRAWRAAPTGAVADALATLVR
ncbi:2-nitropropane dioxygenase [Curtobacterium sp. BH-2-1-1]|uniref:nitronate monooxygenase n=1 Tax=Curtobacterium sp. BH-2-1-1 TaxID=1905847 RepID=UPI00089DF331|nr:nitronate monooxygenase [Curtobacterium sp. BH-2-1-1]AOX66336.1 2-nitropropane dioxygenase [Curtobacterium sp. BH-2-1-1]